MNLSAIFESTLEAAIRRRKSATYLKEVSSSNRHTEGIRKNVTPSTDRKMMTNDDWRNIFFITGRNTVQERTPNMGSACTLVTEITLGFLHDRGRFLH
jgi:hypothetical protein